MVTQLRFDERVVIVTGAGRGLGRAYARLLASRGASVVVNDLGTEMDGTGADGDPALAVVEEILRDGGSAVVDIGDVSTTAGAEAVVATALREYGRLDILVNNAGIIRWAELADADREELDRHLAVHVAGTFNMSRAAWPHLTTRGYGRIVNTISTGMLGLSNLISYGAAKGGVLGLSHGLADAGRSHGILVNMISPLADTRMARGQPGSEPTAAMEALAPDLVAAVVAYLAHEDCQVTGEIYLAGGGRVARTFIGQTAAFVKPDLSPEDVRANWNAINEIAAFDVPSGTMGASIAFHARLDPPTTAAES